MALEGRACRRILICLLARRLAVQGASTHMPAALGRRLRSRLGRGFLSGIPIAIGLGCRIVSTAWIDLHRPGRIHEQAASSRGGGACACAVVVGARREKGGRRLSLERSRGGEARERMRRQNQSSPDPHPSIDHPTPRRPSAGLGWAERVSSLLYASIHSFVVRLIDPPFPPTHTHTQQNRQQAALAEEPQVKPWPRT